MKPIRIFTKNSLEQNLIYIDNVRYVVNVMRRTVGDNIILVNGSNREYTGKISKITKNNIEISNIECIREEKNPNFLGLIFSPIQKIDILVKMATELGITDFMPFKAEYCQIKNYNENRIEKNIIEAIEQSERLDFPKIHKLQNLKKVLESIDKNKSIAILCKERSLNKLNINQLENKKIYIIIGSEGGFSKDEINLIESYDFVKNISLGKNILRTETACASAISIVNYFLG